MKTIFPAAGRDLLIHELRRRPGFPQTVTFTQIRRAVADAINDDVDPATPDRAPRPQLDHVALVASLHRQGVPEPTTRVVSALLEGVWIEIEFIPRPFPHEAVRRREYDVRLQVKGATDDLLAQSPVFRLPEFIARGFKPYQIDADHTYRAFGQRFRQTRRGATTPLTARLIEGRWQGGLYIYAQADREDPSACLARVGQALHEAILPVLSQGVDCDVYQPDGYWRGVWRVDMHLPAAALAVLGHEPVPFTMPDLAGRLLVPDAAHRIALPLKTGLFRNGIWSAELTSNGIDEAANPTPIAEMRRALLEAAHEALGRFGWHHRTDRVLRCPVSLLA